MSYFDTERAASIPGLSSGYLASYRSCVFSKDLVHLPDKRIPAEGGDPGEVIVEAWLTTPFYQSTVGIA